jgi:hypothetical protein
MINGEEYTQLQDYKIKPSTAGFFAIEDGHIRSCGSGTFVSIGKIQGLLTCAHVLKAISDAILLLPGSPRSPAPEERNLKSVLHSFCCFKAVGQ